MTTTITMFDHDHEVSSPSDDKHGNDQSRKEKILSLKYLSYWLVANVSYVIRKHYENFQTIDWLKDLMRSRIRHRNIRAQRRKSWRKRFGYWFDAWSGWICVILVGISAGRFSSQFKRFVRYFTFDCHRSRRRFCWYWCEMDESLANRYL